MHKQAINHKQAIIGGGYLFTENACYIIRLSLVPDFPYPVIDGYGQQSETLRAEGSRKICPAYGMYMFYLQYSFIGT